MKIQPLKIIILLAVFFFGTVDSFGQTSPTAEQKQAPSSSSSKKKIRTISSSDLSSPSGTINGHNYVDLGLSVKWATCNVGASSPSDYGGYYAWGEKKTKSKYTEKNSATFKKKKKDIAGDPKYDAARANWGSTWRLPTKEELDELIDNCTTEWVTRNGVGGYLVTSKKNGNTIFLPAAGYRNGSSLDNAGEWGNYWSSSPSESDSQSACNLFFLSGSFGWRWDDRDYGQSVRPVSE